MTDTAEVTASAEATRGRIAEARAEATDALNLAYELAEVAAAHGWEGVAASMQSARDGLEAVIGQVDRADQAAEAAIGDLGEITARLSSQEVAERLAGVLHHLDAVRDGVDAATGSAGDAWHACQQAGEPGELLGILQILTDDLGEARQCVEHTRTLTESEQQEAGRWGN